MFLYFILGILFAIFILPIIDGLASVILSLLEIPKGKAALKIATYNKKIEELKGGKENRVQQIGFAIGDELQEIEEEEEDDDEY